MPPITIFTGSAGPGIALAATATALHSAAHGQRTLLLSLGSARGLAALLGAQVGHAPAEVAPRLDALTIDAPTELAAAWERGRAQLPNGLAALAGDELPLLPGAEFAFGMLRLRELAPQYQAVFLDAGPHDGLLRAVALPDGLRWLVRLLFGLDRGPGQSAASLGRALLPTGFLPADLLAGVQEARVQTERLREQLTATGTALRYVLRPDHAALAEARIAVPAFQLHGLGVQAIVAGPLLPEALGLAGLADTLAQQEQLLADIQRLWPALLLRAFDLPGALGGPAALHQVGAQLAEAPLEAPDPPISTSWGGAPALAIALPGLPQGALQLALSGDELIVRIGPYRRHILLPEPLRGSNVRATREGEYLVVRRRA